MEGKDKIMIHFNKKEIDKMVKACEYYKSIMTDGQTFNETNNLLYKLKYYEEENC
jgi:hypothetical protein